MIQSIPLNLMANGDIRPCRFVKMDTTSAKDHMALEADTNEKVVGISDDGTNYAPLTGLPGGATITALAAEADQHFKAHGMGTHGCLLELGGTVTAGDYIKSDADGKGTTIATTGTTLQRYGAFALESGVDGEMIPVIVILGSERPSHV